MWTKWTSPYHSEIGDDCLHYIKDYFSLAQKSVCSRSQEYSVRGKNKNLDFLPPNLPFGQLKPSKYPGIEDMQAPCQIWNRRGREFDIVTGQIFSSSWELYLWGPFQQMLELKEKADLSLFLYLGSAGSPQTSRKTRASTFPIPLLTSQESSHLTPITPLAPDGFQTRISKYLRCVFPF